MRNLKFRDGDELSLPVPADTTSGSPVLVGSLVGVTATAEGEGGNPEGYATVWMRGVYDLPVGTTTAVAVGGKVYITSANALTPSDGAGANTLFGHAITAKGTTAGEVVSVKLAKV